MLKNKNHKVTFLILLSLLVLAFILSLNYGAVNISLSEAFSAIRKSLNSENLSLNERIMLTIRLPRTIACIISGAALATGGVLMQALFRNPIVEPGLIGTASGAAFGAALYFVLGATFQFNAGEWTLPVAACLGAGLATFLVFTFSSAKQNGKSSITGLLLTGVAINALFLSGVGFLSYIARDPQARSITFWNLGTLSGANWRSVLITGVSTLCCLLYAIRFSKQLNTLLMGEEEARLLGVNIKALKVSVMIVNVIMIAVVTSFVGVISFVGLVVPHILRMIQGSDNRILIPHSALLGAVLLTIADLAARVLLSPAELPIGILTAAVGVPVFIILLKRREYFF
jgi:iron complex transport system permease protein